MYQVQNPGTWYHSTWIPFGSLLDTWSFLVSRGTSWLTPLVSMVTRYLVQGTWHQVPGTRYLGTWIQGTRYHWYRWYLGIHRGTTGTFLPVGPGTLGTWQYQGTWYMVPGYLVKTWYLVSGVHGTR